MFTASGYQSSSLPVITPMTYAVLAWRRGPPRRVASRLDLSQCQPGMIEKCPAGRRQLDASNAPNKELSADFHFQIAYLPAEGRLRGVQPAFGREGDAALLGDRYEIAQVP